MSDDYVRVQLSSSIWTFIYMYIRAYRGLYPPSHSEKRSHCAWLPGTDRWDSVEIQTSSSLDTIVQDYDGFLPATFIYINHNEVSRRLTCLIGVYLLILYTYFFIMSRKIFSVQFSAVILTTLTLCVDLSVRFCWPFNLFLRHAPT